MENWEHKIRQKEGMAESGTVQNRGYKTQSAHLVSAEGHQPISGALNSVCFYRSCRAPGNKDNENSS